MTRTGILFGCVVLVSGALAGTAGAQDTATSPVTADTATTDAEVRKLQQRIDTLEQRLAEEQAKHAETATRIEHAAAVVESIEKEQADLAKDKKLRALPYYKDGFFMETPDQRFRLQVGGVLHFDARFFGKESSPSGFDIRRARYDIRGNLYKGDIEQIFRLQIEMADTPYLRNGYWIFKARPELALQVGQFKVLSGGADWLTEEAQVNFVEYASGTPVTPFFDRGINLQSHFWKERVQVNAALVTGVGTDVDVNQGDYDSHMNYAGRLLLAPFFDGKSAAVKGLRLAASYESGNQSIKTVRGEASNRTENYESRWYRWTQTYVELESRTRYGAEAHWILGPAALSYEFNRVLWSNMTVYDDPKVNKDTVLATYPDTYRSDVHQVWVSCFLTGEQKRFDDVFFAWRQPKPKKNFSLKEGGAGAWEVIGRFALHQTSPELFEGNADGQYAILDGSYKGWSATAGIHWTLNPKARLLLDLNYLKSTGHLEDKGIVFEKTKSGVYPDRGYREDERAVLLRLILTP